MCKDCKNFSRIEKDDKKAEIEFNKNLVEREIQRGYFLDSLKFKLENLYAKS